MRVPSVASEAVNKTDLRNRAKLVASPGSYFVGRARELRLAAPYFLRNLQPGSYGGTASAHYYNLCGAAYAAMLSAFELMWKALFAGAINAFDFYDANLIDHSLTRDVITTESLLAHREEASVGDTLATSLGTWQKSELVNRRYLAAFQVQPIAGDDTDLVDKLWQVRHVIVHNAGVVGALESYRLKMGVRPGVSLQIDEEYLKYAERELGRVATAGVTLVGERLLRDFFDTAATGQWMEDQAIFTRLYQLGLIVPKTRDLPSVGDSGYIAAQSKYRSQTK